MKTILEFVGRALSGTSGKRGQIELKRVDKYFQDHVAHAPQIGSALSGTSESAFVTAKLDKVSRANRSHEWVLECATVRRAAQAYSGWWSPC